MRLIVTLILVMSSYSGWLFAQPKYPISNVIVFGDSLSDIGNFPEAPKPFIYNKALPSWHHLSPMYDVPVSNPVDISAFRSLPSSVFKPPIGKLFHTHPYHWPNVSSGDLLAHTNQYYRSLSWTEFLLSFAYQDQLISSPVIYPWAQLKTSPIATTAHSVNYAWATATSFDRCNYFKGYNKVPARFCNELSILAARLAYQQNPSADNYLKLIVPGVLKQVELFADDAAAHRVKVDQDTYYVIYVGGNDLLDDYERLASGNPVKMIAGLANIVYWDSHDVYKAALELIKNPVVDAQHIYIVNLFNPGLTPAVSEEGSTAVYAAGVVDDYYNHELRVTVKDLNRWYPGRDIQLVNGYQWYREMSTNSIYQQYHIFDSAKLHQACELSKQTYTDYLTPPTNCQGYMFWNSIHPTMAAQAIFAYRLKQLFSQAAHTRK